MPLRLRNAPTRLMKDSVTARAIATRTTSRAPCAPGERYFPDEMPDRRYYEPVPRGLEIRIARGAGPDAREPKARVAHAGRPASVTARRARLQVASGSICPMI